MECPVAAISDERVPNGVDGGMMAMSNDGNNEEQNLAVSVPMGVVVAGVLLGLLAAAAYVMMQRSDSGVSGAVGQAAKSGKSMRRKLGLTTLITLLENDASRRVILTVLKAIARRS